MKAFRAFGSFQKHGLITDFHLTQSNIEKIAQGGRARWKIENESFNTIKNKGYHFEHNYAHGYKYLSNLLATLMMLVFLFDQLQELGCKLFKKAVIRSGGRRSCLWPRMFSPILKSFRKRSRAF
jgi:hypothetical protein